MKARERKCVCTPWLRVDVSIMNMHARVCVRVRVCGFVDVRSLPISYA